jgi:hypothetical protein
MSNELNNIDDFFRVPIEAESEMPSAAVWDSIQNNFNNNANRQLKKKYKNLKRIAAVLLLLLLSSLFFIATKNKETVVIATDNKSTTKENINTVKNETLQNITTNQKTTLQEQKLIDVKKNNTANNSESEKIISKAKNLKQSYKQTEITKTNNESSTLLNNAIEDIYSKKNRNEATKSKLNINIENSSPSEDEIASDLATENLIEEISIAKNNKIDSIGNKTVLNIKNNSSSNKKSTPKHHEFSFGVYASPEFTFNRLEDDKPHQERTQLQQPNTSRPREDREKIKREENKTTSFSAGILLEYTLNKKISIQSGIGFSSISTEVIPKKIFAEQNAYGAIKYKNNFSLGTTYIDTKLGIVTSVGDSAVLGYSKNTVQYISFPINILYHYSIGKLTLSPTLGFAANILVKQNATSIVEGAGKQNINTIEGVNNSYFKTNMALEFKYKLRKNIAFICVPKINFALNPLNKNSNVKFYSNTVGLALGLKYMF